MKTSEAIEAYLSHQRLRGLQPGTLRTTRHALSMVLATALEDEVAGLAADGAGEARRTTLGQRVSRTSKKKLTSTTQELTLSLTRAFLAWCVSQGWLRVNPLDQGGKVPARAPQDPPIAPQHIGIVAPGVAEAAQRERGLAALTQHPQHPALPCPALPCPVRSGVPALPTSHRASCARSPLTGGPRVPPWDMGRGRRTVVILRKVGSRSSTRNHYPL